jgi:amino acid permease
MIAGIPITITLIILAALSLCALVCLCACVLAARRDEQMEEQHGKR